MAIFMNESDVMHMVDRFDPERFPNLATGADILSALMDWTNSNSDGWAHWRKPQQAASTLIGTLWDAEAQWRNGTLFADITDADLTRALKPIKAFLARQKVAYFEELPWAAILPAS